MKKSAFLLLMFSICLLPLSCGGDTKTDTSYDEKSYEEEVPNKEDKGTVKFLLDGVAWTNDGQNPHNGLNVDAITDHNTVVQFKAYAANGTYLDITVYNVDGIGPGTYALGKTSQAAYESDTGDKLIYITAGMKEEAGSATIESLTETRVTGRFSFKMRNSANPDDVKVVMNGTFDVEFN
ncbi:MAG: DUF6252 family protein [Bacteroidia bacterium]|nr:DUF6252 family protein [Bacteroidia bacterium]